jgi:hypothetical protein
MEKLINKITQLIRDGAYTQDFVPTKQTARTIAEEYKKVAIAFMDYIYTIEHTLLEETDEELFNKFIKEEYGKQ